MAVLPRLEMRLVRGSSTAGEIGIVMRTTAVEVPPYLLAPAMLASWMYLTPFFALQAALAACGRPGVERPGAPAADPPAGAADAGRSEVEPCPPPSLEPANVVRFPSRDRPA